MGMGWSGACLTSLERIRYRTMRPRSTASVWLSKSGELMPGEEQLIWGRAHPLGLQGRRQGARERSTEGKEGAPSQAILVPWPPHL